MISYAQNREDALLNRVFGGQAQGFYIDIGAHHPVNDSITRHFYDRGWRGINVEPGDTFELLARERPRDINLNCAASNRQGEATYYEFSGTGLSTLSAQEACARAGEGRAGVQRQVPTQTLAALCEQYAPSIIDFISIDVEGHEREVVEGGDWRRFRPRVVVIESTRPNSTEATHELWEGILLGADYVYATFDGLNRFYVRGEEPGLAGPIRRPVSVLDGVVPFAHVRESAELQAKIAALELQLLDLRRSRPLRYLLGRGISCLRSVCAGAARPASARPSFPAW